MRPAVAAGHPATMAAGVEILEAGGTAADAAVAAALASCVAETVMTGLLGGGHAIYFDAARGRARNLDCFVAVPGLGLERRPADMVELEVPFGEELVHYAVGVASCGVPGLPAGLEALWREHGRLPWRDVCRPALELARRGTVFPAAHAACLRMLAPVMTMNEGARIYAPAGDLLEAGDVLEQPGLVRAIELVADEGGRSAYRGSLAEALLELVDAQGGLVTETDLRTYEPAWSEPLGCQYLYWPVLTRRGISGVPGAFAQLRGMQGRDEAERALAIVYALAKYGPRRDGHTTNLTVVDARGNACVFTTSLGLGSGDFLPGLDLHLNSMLGEKDLLVGELEPGRRMESMMAPLLAFGRERLALAAGAAGGTRLRSALVQVVSGILDDRLDPEDAVERPRLHPAGGLVHLEPGFSDEAKEALEGAGWRVAQWPEQHHYFGGVSVVAEEGAAGDPRRSGAARVL